MSVRILHAADLHIDSPLAGLRRYEGAPVEEIRGATRRAFANLVGFCLSEQVHLLLLAGDLYDGDSRDYATALFLGRELARLREVGTQVVWIRGNHDAQSRLTRHLALGEHVHELPARSPSSLPLEPLGVVVHGQGFATQHVTEDLSRGYPAPVPGAFNIGLLHTALGGRRGHAPYAPCELAELVHKGYDYWALGHVHAREVVAREPFIVFPGNLQGRHVRETGVKGASLFAVEDGRASEPRHIPLDVVRFANERIDIAAAHDVADVLALCADGMDRAAEAAQGRLVTLRITLLGKSRAHPELARDRERFLAELRARANQVSAGDVWLEDVRVESRPRRELSALSARDDALGELVRALEPVQEGALSPGLEASLAQTLAALPAELRAEELGLAALDGAEQRSLAEGAVSALLGRILGEA